MRLRSSGSTPEVTRGMRRMEEERREEEKERGGA
jgi:hypothetical protein